MLETMKRLDAHANALLLTGASDIDLLGGMFDVMPDFKALLDAGYGGEIDKNAGRFPGFHRYAVMLPNVDEGIEAGSIRLPRVRKSVGWGKSVAVRVDPGGRRVIKKK